MNVVGKKMRLCKFWQQGWCRSGSACVFAHGEAELGAVNEFWDDRWQQPAELTVPLPPPPPRLELYIVKIMII